MLSVYLLSLRLSGVLEVDTSVGRRCSTIVGEDLSVVFVGWGPAMGINLSRTMLSSGLARGIPDSVLLICCAVGAGWSRHSWLYSLAFVGLAVGGFLGFLEFSAPFFSDLFPWTSQVRLVLAVWGATLLEEGYSGWALTCNVAEDLLCFLFFLLLRLATRS